MFFQETSIRAKLQGLCVDMKPRKLKEPESKTGDFELAS